MPVEALTFDPAIHGQSFDPEQHPATAFVWRAIYDDGRFLDEYGAGGSHGFKDIDQAKLTQLVLIPQRPGLVWHTLRITGDSRPIFFRRRHMEVAAPPEQAIGDKGEIVELPLAPGGLDVWIHVLGFQRTIKGVNVQSLTAYFEDGSSLVTDDPDGF